MLWGVRSDTGVEVKLAVLANVAVSVICTYIYAGPDTWHDVHMWCAGINMGTAISLVIIFFGSKQ